jgi:hypothetical protein
MFDFDRLLTEVQAEPLLGVSRRTLQSYRVRGVGPPYVKLSPTCDGDRGAVRYRPSHLLDFKSLAPGANGEILRGFDLRAGPPPATHTQEEI